MIKAAEVIGLISNTGSTIDKQFILKKNENVPGLKEILRFIYNPYSKTGISAKKLSKYIGAKMPDKNVTYTEAIDYFTIHQTGTDADVIYATTFIANQPKEVRWLAKALVTQELKIGVTATTLNKVYGKTFIPRVGCMLGTLFSQVGEAKAKWPCIVTEKLDGIRRILIKENGNIRCFSRSGHEDTDLVEIVEEAKFLPDNYMYDGELIAIGKFKNCIEQRQATNSIANSKGYKAGLIFNVFDMVSLDEFYAGTSKWDARSRKIQLGATFGDYSIKFLTDEYVKAIACYSINKELEHIKPVPILGLVNSVKEVEPIVAPIWKAGFEGVMLNTVGGKYEIKRSKELLKIKHTEELVLPIVDMLEGTGKFEGMMGSLIVDYKGREVGVGSGFTDAQRKMFWDNYSSYIGVPIEVETFGESTNVAGGISLNCPIFKRVYGEVE